MQIQSYPSASSTERDSQDAFPPLRVVIAYGDVVAAKTALHVVSDFCKGMEEAVEFQSDSWSFLLLANAEWATVAAIDAIEADVLVFATSDGKPLPSAVQFWAEAVIHRKRGSSAAVVALFGPENQPDGTGFRRLEFLRAATQRAGLDFFAPASGMELAESHGLHASGVGTRALKTTQHQSGPVGLTGPLTSSTL